MTRDLNEILHLARHVAGAINKGFVIDRTVVLEGRASCARIDGRSRTDTGAEQAFSFSVDRALGIEALQAQIGRELRRRLCPVCDTIALISRMPEHAILAIHCSACHWYRISEPLAELFWQARRVGDQPVVDRLVALARYLRTAKEPDPLSGHNWLALSEQNEAQQGASEERRHRDTSDA